MKIITVLITLLIADHLFAQTPDTTMVLDEMVISATKIPEIRSKLSQFVYVIPQARIRKLNAQSTADLLSMSGMVNVQKSQQGGGSPQIRGFEASRILLVVDDIRMNNLIYRAGHLQNVITVDNNMLERAEVLYGPSSTMYGSDALGGVVYLKTVDPELSDSGFRLSGDGLLRYGTVNNEKTAHLKLQFRNKRFAALSAVTVSDFGDLRMGAKENPALGRSFGERNYYAIRAEDNLSDVMVENKDPLVQKPSGYRQVDLMQKFLFQPTASVSHLVNIQYSTSTDIPRYDRLTEMAGNTLRFAEWYYGPQERLLAAYKFRINDPVPFADGLTITASYQAVEESRNDRRFNNNSRRSQIEEVDVAGLTIDFQKSLAQHNLHFGYDQQLNWLTSTAFRTDIISGERTATATRYPDGENHLHHFGLYVTHAWDINSKLILNDGIRAGYSTLYSKFNDKTFFPFPFDEVKQNNPYLSGNIGLVYKPGDAWRFSLLTSTAYRVPNIDDLSKVFETSSGSALIVPNPGLEPEQTVNVDLGINVRLDRRLLWENTLYYTSFYNAIVVDDFTFNGEPVIDYDGVLTPVVASQNKGKAYLYGMTSRLVAQLANRWSAAASYTYTYGRIKSSPEQPLDHIAPPFGRGSVRYQSDRFDGELFVNFSGWKRIEDYFLNGEDNEQYAPEEGMPSWYTINARASYQMNKLTLQAGLDNILDLQYRVFASGINAPGRNFFVAVRFGF